MSVETQSNATLDGIALHYLARELYHGRESAIDDIENWIDDHELGEIGAVISLSNVIMVLSGLCYELAHPEDGDEYSEDKSVAVLKSVAEGVIDSTVEWKDDNSSGLD